LSLALDDSVVVVGVLPLSLTAGSTP